MPLDRQARRVTVVCGNPHGTGGDIRAPRSTRVLIGSLLALALAASGAAAPAAAASTLVTSFVADHSGTACAGTNANPGTLPSGMFMTGIAFDGSRLLLSCWGDNTITAVSPVDGHQLAVYHIGNANLSFGALAWDAQTGTLWACKHESVIDSSVTVGTIDLATQTWTPAFATNPSPNGGCIDGLSIDPSDGTVWAGGDHALTIQRYTQQGVQIGGNIPVPSPVSHKSGLAVTGDTVLIADPHAVNTQQRIFAVPNQLINDKFTQTPVLVASYANRIEDVECDDVTFQNQGKTVLWAQGANDNLIRAWKVNGSCGPAGPSLGIDVSASAPSVTADGQVTFSVTVTNPDQVDAVTNATVQDTLPVDSVIGAITPSSGTCSGTAPVSCSLGTIAAASSATVAITVTPIQPEGITDSAVATADGYGLAGDAAQVTVGGAPATAYERVTSTGFLPAQLTAVQGTTVQWNILAGTHSATDARATGLFDSGPLAAVDDYAFALNAAATYSVKDTASTKTSTVKVPLTAPATATVNTPFQVTWASAPPSSPFTEDVQVEKPGTTSFVKWVPLSTAASAQYTPARPGTYRFRARLHDTANGSFTLWSPVFSVSVS
jgi:uncharacterized repeat protein (TIGR01451 family)